MSDKAPCLEPGCDRCADVRGFCRLHYRRRHDAGTLDTLINGVQALPAKPFVARHAAPAPAAVAGELPAAVRNDIRRRSHALEMFDTLDGTLAAVQARLVDVEVAPGSPLDGRLHAALEKALVAEFATIRSDLVHTITDGGAPVPVAVPPTQARTPRRPRSVRALTNGVAGPDAAKSVL